MRPVDRLIRSVIHAAREAALIATGLAVLTYQEVQVRRRESERERHDAPTPGA